jgi:cytochrome oxidase Cu insertion factor (SCO1/SenC/PrrC family)
MPSEHWCKQAIRLLALWIFLLGFHGLVRAAGLPPLPVKVGEKAPNFTLTSSDGRPVSLADFAGHNVLIDFYRGYW